MIELDIQPVIFEHLGLIPYKIAWDYQESLLHKNVSIKTAARLKSVDPKQTNTRHYLLLCVHPPVYTLGKGGNAANILLPVSILNQQGIEYFVTNRGGDITFHGPGQIVGYPIFDLEKFYTDIGKYLRNLEEVIIKTIGAYGLKGERSKGETGVWLDAGIAGKERKICAIGVRCSRWVTMHGFALNVKTDLNYFNNIVPCGIVGKKVTSLQNECEQIVSMDEVTEKIKQNFELVFGVEFKKL
ncbi:MAG: lipoyl(octanoyl) transferase LipB [Ferruginibacter sp.]